LPLAACGGVEIGLARAPLLRYIAEQELRLRVSLTRRRCSESYLR
jgi:hypothetical protein